MTVKVAGHEHPRSTLIRRTLTAQTVDLAVFINLRIKTDNLRVHTNNSQSRTHAWQVTYLVIFKHSKLNLLSLVLVLLGSGVGLLLPLLSTTTQSQHEMQSGLLDERAQCSFGCFTVCYIIWNDEDWEPSNLNDRSAWMFIHWPSECCSQTGCVRPPAVSQQRSTSADQEGFLHSRHLAVSLLSSLTFSF